MLLSAVSVLVVAQSSSEIPEGLMNNPVLLSHSPMGFFFRFCFHLMFTVLVTEASLDHSTSQTRFFHTRTAMFNPAVTIPFTALSTLAALHTTHGSDLPPHSALSRCSLA